jgi:hypothetical protein
MSSNFEVRFVNDDNILLYLPEEIIEKIKSTISKTTLYNIPKMK